MSRGTRTGDTARERHREKRPRPRRAPIAIPFAPVSPAAHAAAVVSSVALAIGIYHGCLHGAFVFDDLNAVAQSTLIRSLTPITRFLTNSTRPLVDFGIALNYAIGEYNTWWYHFTSVVLHAANSVLVYFLVLRTLTLPAVAERYGANRQPIAWATALLFAAHPLASETVAYISSRSEVQVAFFYLLTMYSYAVAVTTTNATRRRWATVGIPVFTAAALGSKEIGLTIPVALLLYDWVFLASGDWRLTRQRWKTIALTFIPIAVGILILLVIRPGALFAPYSQSAGINFERYTRLQYFMTQQGVILHYLRLVVAPFDLNFDYDWPLTTEPSLAVALAFGLLTALVAGAVLVRRSQPLAAFAMLFTMVVLAPTSSWIRIADLAVERRMYIPLFAFMLLAAGCAADLVARFSRHLSAPSAHLRSGIFTLLIALPLAGFAALTNARANLWGDDLALQLDAATKSPRSPRTRLNLGVIYLNSQRVEDAHRELFEAKRLYDLDESIHAFPRIGAFIHYNLGAVLYIEKDFDQADVQLKRALEIGGQFLALRPMAYLIRAHIARNRGDWATTEAYLKEATKFNRDHPDWYLTLAEAQLKQGKSGAAKGTLVLLEKVHPGASKSDFGKSLYRRIGALQRAARDERDTAKDPESARRE